MADLYQLLGVSKAATTAEIRRAYQKRARALHPDLNPGDPAAVERFAAISEAFAVLSDEKRRGGYDRGEPGPVRAAAPEVGFEGFDFSTDLRVSGAAFREVLDGVLHPQPPDPGKAATRGEDLEQLARVSFEESFRGASRRIHVMRLDGCPSCAGAGVTRFGPVPCASCGGAGALRASRGRMIFRRRCTDCDASGVIDRRTCARCDGEGRLMQSEWLEVQIPPGVRGGSRVRLAGLGNAGRRGGPPGDFFLVVEVEPHAFYRREEHDLHCVVPVTITEAALGAHIAVPTPDGPVTIEIPAGTQAGQRFRLRKRGVPRLGEKGRGDLFVEVRVWVPTVSDDRSRALLAEFAQRNPDDPRRDLAGGM